jgi:hypothetical protein
MKVKFTFYLPISLLVMLREAVSLVRWLISDFTIKKTEKRVNRRF